MLPSVIGGPGGVLMLRPGWVAQEARQCRTSAGPFVHLAFLDGLECWSRQSMTREQTRARANAIRGTGLVAFHILDTSMALKKKSMLTSPTLVLIRSSLDFFHCFARTCRQARV